jgi:hypothetical protein
MYDYSKLLIQYVQFRYAALARPNVSINQLLSSATLNPRCYVDNLGLSGSDPIRVLNGVTFWRNSANNLKDKLI